MMNEMNNPVYEPISYFGKENTQRTKRAHERKPKKTVKNLNIAEQIIAEWRSTRECTRQRGKFVPKKEKVRVDPFEPIVYRGPSKKPDGQKLLKSALKDLQD